MGWILEGYSITYVLDVLEGLGEVAWSGRFFPWVVVCARINSNAAEFLLLSVEVLCLASLNCYLIHYRRF